MCEYAYMVDIFYGVALDRWMMHLMVNSIMVLSWVGCFHGVYPMLPFWWFRKDIGDVNDDVNSWC